MFPCLQPSVLVCRHQRDALSLRSSGQNLSVQWRDPADLQDEHRHAALVVQTKQSHLLHYSLLYTPQPYWVPDKGTSGPKVDFPPGSGEGTPIPGLSLKTDSYLDLHQEGLSAWCATDEFCLVVAKEPLQLVCIPWSAFYTNLERVKTAPDAPKRGTFHGASVTRFSDIDWLIDKTCAPLFRNLPSSKGFASSDKPQSLVGLAQLPSSRSHSRSTCSSSCSSQPTAEPTMFEMSRRQAH